MGRSMADRRKMKKGEARNLIGCCGLYCGLCNKYQSKAPSRCVGCRLGEQHAWCSIWNCCAKKHRFGTCAECGSMADCPIFLRRKVVEWIPAYDNLRLIKKLGSGAWLKEQRNRQGRLEKLLQEYNDGRSASFYCKVCARMPIGLIDRAIGKSKARLSAEKVQRTDMKWRAGILRESINGSASKAGIRL